MQKRVALARALVTDPKIVLFDEPTTGQDPIRKNMILSMIVHYRRKFGFTAVMISHDIPDVFFISDRIVILWEGAVGFEGTYEEAVRLKLPMIDEFLRSLEGFQDELTGLLSREAFRVHYAAMLGGSAGVATVSAALFSVEFDLLHEALGPQAAVEVLRALGEYTNRRFNPIGGFSARHSRDEILTIFPHTSIDKARQLVADFAQELKHEAIDRIQSIAMAKMGAATCFDIYIRAGVAEVSPAGRHRSDNRESPGKARDCRNTPMRHPEATSNEKIFHRNCCRHFRGARSYMRGLHDREARQGFALWRRDLPALCPVRLGLRTEGRQLGRNLRVSRWAA